MTEDTKEAYQMMDVNVYQENLFHTKMMLKETDLNTYLFGVSTADLSEEDQSYLKSLAAKEHGSEIPGIDAVPGKISGIISCEGSEWHYHVYLPKAFHMGRKWPVCFIMSAGGGKGGKPISRYIKGAERFGCILVTSVESKNGFSQAGEAVTAMADDAYKRLPLEDDFTFSSGMSGGSRMSFLLAEANKNLSGVLACGSGAGIYPDSGDFRQPKLRSKTYVYSLIGTNCFNRTEAAESHQGFSDDCRLRFFPGNHTWAEAPLIEQGMARVMGQIILDHKDLSEYQEDYLTALKGLIEDLKAKEPWESDYLASFGAEMDDRFDGGYFKKTSNELEGDPQVKLAMEAEEDILDFANEFFASDANSKKDSKELPNRSEAADKLAAKYESIPHGKLIKLLGDKSPPPKKKK